MDIGSIVSNALGGLIGGLALFLLVEVGKHIRRTIKKSTSKPKEVLDNRLRDSQEYQQILRNRKTQRTIGYMCVFDHTTGYHFDHESEPTFTCEMNW